MQHFIDAVRDSIQSKNWYSALFISLSLPDICGKIDEPDAGSKRRTINWYNKYLIGKYTMYYGINKTEHIFMSGTDFYALRCAYLHEGADNIAQQSAQDVLERFRFVQPDTVDMCFHRNQSGRVLQLQVDKFTQEIIDAIEAWLAEIEGDEIKMKAMDSFLKIEHLTRYSGFRI